MGGGGGGGVFPPPPPPPHVLVPKNTLTDVIDNTCDISDLSLRAHIFSPRTTQQLPKKYNEAGTPLTTATDALSEIDYRHTSATTNSRQLRTNWTNYEKTTIGPSFGASIP